MELKDKLESILETQLKAKGLDNEQHHKRLKAELQEVEMQGEEAYFLDLYEKGIKYEQNENDLLIVYLLDIASDFDINKSTVFIQRSAQYFPGKGTTTKEPKTKSEKSMRNYEYSLRTFQKNIIKWQAAKKFCERRGFEFYILTPKFFQDKENPKVKLF